MEKDKEADCRLYKMPGSDSIIERMKSVKGDPSFVEGFYSPFAKEYGGQEL